MIELNGESPIEWIMRELSRECDEADKSYEPKVSEWLSVLLYVFENGRRYEHLLLQHAIMSTPAIELPAQLPEAMTKGDQLAALMAPMTLEDTHRRFGKPATTTPASSTPP